MPQDSDSFTNNSLKTESGHFLEACLFYNVNVLSRQLLKLAEQAFAPLKLSPAHASLLLILYDHPGINPKKLGELLQLTPSTITRFIDVLAKKELVRRQKKGKQIAIFSTEKGLEAKSAIAQAYIEFYLSYTHLLGTGYAQRLALQIHDAGQRLTDSLSSENSHDPDL